MNRLHLLLAFWLAALSTGQAASLLDKLRGTKGTNQAATALTGALSQDQMIQGLKEALGQGMQKAVSQLGTNGGFLTNLNVKIPMPEKLQSVETALRKLKQERLADEFVTTMNRAAEQAVPVAAGVFSDAVKQMNVADAKQILSGPNDAATQYFRRVTQTNLYTRFHPIVKQATEAAGVTAAYKQLMDKAGGVASLGNSFGFGKTLGIGAVDVDAYVTDKAMDGLFKMVAEEEKRIRENPVARTTDLMKKVFGSVAK
jgi:hypothetical protein